MGDEEGDEREVEDVGTHLLLSRPPLLVVVVFLCPHPCPRLPGVARPSGIRIKSLWSCRNTDSS